MNPSPRAKTAAWKRRGKIAVVASAGLAYVGYCLFSDLGFVLLLFLGLFFGLLKSLLGNINQGAEEFAQEARDAEANLRNLQYRWRHEASEEVFKGKLQELRVLTDEYRYLPEIRKRKVRELEKALYNIQLRHFLEQFDIASAVIPHIKDGRIAMLSAYGIDDAADVSRVAIEAVPGFGESLVTQLLTWRQSLEAKFRFEPGRGIDPADLRRVDQEIGKRRMEIEVLLSRGPAELNALRGRIITARGQLQGQLEKAFQDVAQAQANELGAA
jgi:DNA-binding helix-hairpin-helix protein with protein kinase domain